MPGGHAASKAIRTGPAVGPVFAEEKMVATTPDEKTFDFATAMAIARSVFSFCQRRVEKGRPLAWDHVNLATVVAGVINGRDDFTVDEVRRGGGLGIHHLPSLPSPHDSLPLFHQHEA